MPAEWTFWASPGWIDLELNLRPFGFARLVAGSGNMPNEDWFHQSKIPGRNGRGVLAGSGGFG
jgi:hypothetical protein